MAVTLDLASAVGDRYVLSKEEAATLATTFHFADAAALLPALVDVAAARPAPPPTSGYRVGAAGLGASGAVYLGANLELPAAPLAASVHAEQSLVALAAQHGEPRILRIAVSAAPCGHCRQFCVELAGADQLDFVFGVCGGGTCAPTPLATLLPRQFGPADLAPPGTRPPLLLGGAVTPLAWTEAAARAVAAAPAPLAGAAAAALEAATRAHAPYTGSVAGAALVWRRRVEEDGAPTTSAGFAIESAAYNPSLPPLQAALVAARAAGLNLAAGGRITAAVLVEVDGAKVAHAPAAAAALAAVAPGVELTVLLAARK